MPTPQLESGTRLRIAKFFDTATPLSLRSTLELPWQYYLVFAAAIVVMVDLRLCGAVLFFEMALNSFIGVLNFIEYS
jgi:hypothetical protein